MLNKIKVVHCTRSSMPFVSGGSIRTKYIVETQKKWYDVVVLVSNYKHYKKQTQLGFQYMINEIPYFICDNNYLLCRKRPLSTLNSWYSIVKFKSFIINVCQKLKPDIIHGHSSFNTGLPALLAAKHLKLPFIYELRSITEYSRLANKVFDARSFSMSWLRHWEEYVIKNADAIVCINDGVRHDIVKRGLIRSENSITIPNGVDTEHFFRTEPNTLLLKKWNLDGCFTIGMVSPQYHEGIFFLINSIGQFFNVFPNDRLIIIGDGKNQKETEEVKREIIRNGITKNVIFVGRVPFENMNECYNSINVFILPRLNTKENNLVSPLKPLEMMAAERTILVSDVEGLSSLVRHGETGYIFKAEDSDDLIDKLIQIRKNAVAGKKIGDNARKWVIENRSWETVTLAYKNIYEKAMQDRLHYTVRTRFSDNKVSS